MDEAKGSTGRKGPRTRLIRRPKGMSDYQAAWIVESESEEEEAEGSDHDSGDGEDDAMAEDDGAQAAGGAGSGGRGGMRGDREGDAGVASDDDGGSSEEEYEEDETQDEKLAAARYDSERRLQKQRAGAAAEQEEAEFPDEVETPLEMPASKRFAKYRGLKSFRSTPWDPYESLPESYGRIFSFQSYQRTRRRALEAAATAALLAVGAGTYVRCRIANVPAAAAAAYMAAAGAAPAVLVGLLQHECKLSVLHFAVSKTATYALPLKSKAAVEFHFGFRRLVANPIYSQDGRGDKFKFERFLSPGLNAVATVFGPITYGPAPVLAFTPDASLTGLAAMAETATVGGRQLIATGTLRAPDPERIVLKRIIITGCPHKVHKRKVMVKYMFHNPEDVRWFRPVELWTKYGRHGKIKEPVGTHGSMKCIFDGVMQQRDTVCASLYKRIFPKLDAAPGSTL